MVNYWTINFCFAVVPIAPVLASLIVDLVLGDNPTDDLIVRRTEAESL